MMSESKETRVIKLQDLGTIDYKDAWEYQTKIHKGLIADKRAHKDQIDSYRPVHQVLICEHPAVFTLGKSGKESHLLTDEDRLKSLGIDFYKINRGGDITYHGPGQLVLYPVLDLEDFFRDVHRYVRSLEEIVIRTVSDFGIHATRHEGFTGVWIDGTPKRKICAIGVHLSRWVSLHGLALNVEPDMTHFQHIVACGISESDRSVTSMSKELKESIDMDKVKERLIYHFSEIFDCSLEA